MSALTTLFVAGLVAVGGVSGSSDPLFEVVRLETDYGRGCSGDIVELKDGSLLFATHVAGEFWKPGIVARISKDGGRTWGEEYSLVAPATGGRDARCANWAHPSLLRLPNDDILMWSSSPPVRIGGARSWCGSALTGSTKTNRLGFFYAQHR